MADVAAAHLGLLPRFGGHAMAAGFALDIAKIEAFRTFLATALADARAYPRAADLVLDGTLAPASATLELASIIASLGPFGAGNPEPIFVFPRLRVAKAERIGRDGNTIRAFLQAETGGSLKAMLFRAADSALGQALLSRSNGPLHIAGQLRIDRWNGATTLSVTIQDATPA
jgi:single-stranded-DNA-specific exonuclease